MISNWELLKCLTVKPKALALSLTKPQFLRQSTVSVSTLTPAHVASPTHQKHKGFQIQAEASRTCPKHGQLQHDFPQHIPDQI